MPINEGFPVFDGRNGPLIPPMDEEFENKLNHVTDAYVLHELIQGIYVDAPDKSSGKRKQHIHIKYDGVGFIPLSMLRNEETA